MLFTYPPTNRSLYQSFRRWKQAAAARMIISYEEDPGLSDIEYIGEASSDLLDNSWTTLGVTVERDPPVNGVQAVHTLIDASGGKVFMRLRVERRLAGP